MFNRNLYATSFIIVSLVLLIFILMYNNNNKIVLTSSSIIDMKKYQNDPYPTKLKDHEVIEIKG
jgi:hypothetical protein